MSGVQPGSGRSESAEGIMSLSDAEMFRDQAKAAHDAVPASDTCMSLRTWKAYEMWCRVVERKRAELTEDLALVQAGA